jgi:hypothetical protein
MFPRYSLILLMMLLLASYTTMAQVTSSANLACTVTASGGMGCNGIVSGDLARKSAADKGQPELSVTYFTLEPGAALDQTASPCCDAIIVGIAGGELVNEKLPSRYVSLTHDSVTLLPKGESFLLRNKGSQNVALRLIEIKR